MYHKLFHLNSYFTHYEDTLTPKGLTSLIMWLFQLLPQSLLYKIQLFYQVPGSYSLGIWT